MAGAAGAARARRARGGARVEELDGAVADALDVPPELDQRFAVRDFALFRELLTHE